MNKATVVQEAQTASFLPPAQGILQRKCACGNHTVAGGECAECGKGKNNLQLKDSNQNALGASHSLTHSSIIQPKVTIGMSNDPPEQEVDRVADQVLAASAPSVVSATPLHIQRYAGQSTERSDTTPAPVNEVPPIVHEVLRSSGQPLDAATRACMESRFGHDFSSVRVHTDAKAVESARAVNALAYTVGRDVAFREGMFAPQTFHGRHLLAHELAHVVQQNSLSQSLNRSASGLTISDPADPLERSAETMAGKAMTQTSPSAPSMPLLSAPHGRTLFRIAEFNRDACGTQPFTAPQLLSQPGVIEHKLIERDYFSTHPQTRIDYSIPESGQGGTGATGFVDIANIANHQLYEIKSKTPIFPDVYLILKGVPAIERFVDKANKFCGPPKWDKGTDYIPTKPIFRDPVSGVELHAEASRPGLIGYEWKFTKNVKELAEKVRKNLSYWYVLEREARAQVKLLVGGDAVEEEAAPNPQAQPAQPGNEPQSEPAKEPDKRPGWKPEVITGGKGKEDDKQSGSAAQPDQIPLAARTGMDAVRYVLGLVILAALAAAASGLKKVGGKAGGPLYVFIQWLAAAFVIVLWERQAKAGGEKVDDDPLVALAQMFDDTGQTMPPEIRKLIEEDPVLRELLRIEIEKRRRSGAKPSGSSTTSTPSSGATITPGTTSSTTGGAVGIKEEIEPTPITGLKVEVDKSDPNQKVTKDDQEIIAIYDTFIDTYEWIDVGHSFLTMNKPPYEIGKSYSMTMIGRDSGSTLYIGSVKVTIVSKGTDTWKVTISGGSTLYTKGALYGVARAATANISPPEFAKGGGKKK